MRELFQLNYNFGEAEKQAEEPQKKRDSLDFFQRHLHEKRHIRDRGPQLIPRHPDKHCGLLPGPDLYRRDKRAKDR